MTPQQLEQLKQSVINHMSHKHGDPIYQLLEQVLELIQAHQRSQQTIRDVLNIRANIKDMKWTELNI